MAPGLEVKRRRGGWDLTGYDGDGRCQLQGRRCSIEATSYAQPGVLYIHLKLEKGNVAAKVREILSNRPSQRCYLFSFSAMRAFTSFRSRVDERGRSVEKRMVPFDVWKEVSSDLKASITDELMGKRLQWLEKAA